MKIFFTFFLSALFAVNYSYGQIPANDLCANAQVISIPGSGSTCLTGTNAGATNDGFFVGGCTGPNGGNGVWYTFVATGSDNTVTITPNGATPAQQVAVVMITGGCNQSTWTINSCNASTTNNGQATITWTFSPGTQIWLQVTSLMSDGGFQICVTSVTPPPAPGKTCATATKLCDKTNFTLATIPTGGNAFKPTCWGFANSLNRPVFYQFTVGQTGLLNWMATPNCTGVEFDWALYNITGGCNGTMVACNYNYAGANSSPFGMQGGPAAGCNTAAGGETCQGVNVTAGNTYVIIIDQFTTSKNCGFSFSWAGSTFQMAPTSVFTATPASGCAPLSVSFTNNSVAASSYSWNFGNGNSSTSQNPTSQTYSSPGSYIASLTATSASGCTHTSTQTITVNNNTTPTINPAGPYCATSPAVNLTATPTGGTWTGNGITNASAGTFNPSVAGVGTHIITYTPAGSCSSPATANIVVNNNATVTINSAGPFCSTDPATTLTASGSSGGTWSGNGITNASTGQFDPSVAGNGTHIISYTVGGTCGGSDTAAIVVGSISISNVSTTNPKCNGDCNGQIVITSSGATQYSINGGTSFQASNTFNNLCQGNYNLVVQGSNASCQATSTASLTQPSVLTINNLNITNVSCYGKCDGTASASVSGGTTPYSYQWLPTTKTGPSVTGLCPGNYTLRIIDANACQKDSAFVVTEPVGFTITPTSSNSNCGQPDGTAGVNVSGATPSYSYLWSNGSNQPFATNLTNGNYCVTITDANTCDSVVCITVGLNAPPTATASSTPSSCNGACSGTATVTASGGTTPGNYTYQWSANAAGQTTQTASNLCAGSYTVTVSDGNNCTVTTSVNISQPPPVVVITNADTTICYGSSASLTAQASGGNSPYTFNWSGGLTGTGPHMVSPSANTCYTVTATDANGCASPAATTCVSLLSPITVNTTGSQSICTGGSATINATAINGNGGPYSFQWQLNGNVIANTQTVTVQPPGSTAVTYIVIVSDNCSPNDTGYVTIDFYPNPVVSFSPDSSAGCAPHTVSFSNNSTLASSCEWDMGDGNSIFTCSGFNYLYPTAGSYQVNLTVTSPQGCKASSVVPANIAVFPNPIAAFDFSPQESDVQNMVINFNDNSVGNISQWTWEFYNNSNTLLGTSSQSNPVFNLASVQTNPFIYFLNDTGLYPVHLTVTTNYGCTDDTVAYVKIGGVLNISIPNAFTPDGDGLNDFFFPVGVGFYPNQKYLLQIFNRWGELIFKSESLDNAWDGKHYKTGTNVEEGIYVWKLNYQDYTTNQKIHLVTGSVMLMRR